MMKNQSDFRILIVDDNLAIQNDFIKILSVSESADELADLGEVIFGEKIDTIKMPTLEIDTASQGEEGVEKVATALREGRPYALAFVDIRMPPGWDGIETIKHMWSLDKDIQIVICTAYSDYTWEETVSNLGQTANLLILKKPFDNVAVRQLACALTMKWKLLQEQREYALLLEEKVLDRTLSLQKSLSLVEATLESSNNGILVIDSEGNISKYNNKLIDLWNAPSSLLKVDKNANELITYMSNQLLDHGKFINEFDSLMSDSQTIKTGTLRFDDGRFYQYYSQPQKIAEKTIGRIFDFRDITQQIKLENKLQYQASHDYLTALPNRIMLIEKIRKLTNPDNKEKFATLFIDLDRFKTINDSLGHALGDNLLRSVSTRLTTAISKNDLLARIGGDEFVLILTNVIDEANLTVRTQNILECFRKPYNINGRDIMITASIGISIYPDNGEDPGTLLKNADTAMYKAKEIEGESFSLYSSEMGDNSLGKLDKEIELRHAIENNEFFVCYQPQFNLISEEIVAVEALIRWNHPKLGILQPVDFIALAEEVGLISTIGEWVLRTACYEAKKLEALTGSPIRMAVNVTAQQFKQRNLVEIVKNILEETKLQPQYLELELTENIIISDLNVIKIVDELKKIGVTIAVDDFGTGFTSLGYLKTVALDRLKIDKSFIQHIRNEMDDEVIIRAIIAIAKNLNMEVLAEGVENVFQLNFLKKHECGDIQGFYISKPLTAENLEKLMKSSSGTHISQMLGTTD